MAETKIVAIITTSRDQIGGGGAPIFYCQSIEEQQQIAFTLEKCLDAIVQQITPSTLIVVQH